MFAKIQPFLRNISTKQAGLGVVAFAGGFGLGLYLGRPRQVEIVIEPVAPDPALTDNVRVLRDATIHDLALVSNPISEEYYIREVEDDSETEIVISPPPQDPTLIAVDLDAMRRRDKLIDEYGFTEGMRRYQEEFSMGTDNSTDEDLEVVTLFSDEQDNWDADAEAANRSTDAPYILHKDEYWREELGYTQTTLTYYEGDNVLVDQEEVPIYSHESIVGPLMFGHGSNDQNVFYVRNDKLRAEYEIIRDRGHYAIEVLGLEQEQEIERSVLKHSLGKFRPDD